MGSLEVIGLSIFLVNIIAYLIVVYAIYKIRDYVYSFEHAFFITAMLLSVLLVFMENLLFISQYLPLRLLLYHVSLAPYYKFIIAFGTLSYGFLGFRSAMIMDYNPIILTIIAVISGTLFSTLLLTLQISFYDGSPRISYSNIYGAKIAALTSIILISIPLVLLLYEYLQLSYSLDTKYKKVMMLEIAGHMFLVIAFIVLYFQRLIIPGLFPFTFFLLFWALGVIILALDIIILPLPYRILVIGHVNALFIYSTRNHLLIAVDKQALHQSHQDANDMNTKSIGIIGVNSLIRDILSAIDNEQAELIASGQASNLIIIPYKDWIGTIQMGKNNSRLGRYVLRQLLWYISTRHIKEPEDFVNALKSFVGFFFQFNLETHVQSMFLNQDTFNQET